MITPPYPQAKILVGMSGGVDSSTAALLLKKAGWDVHGVTLLLWGGKRQGSSCSTGDSVDAQKAADEIEIPLEVVDWTDDFNNEVINDFKDGVENGLTPNPCISCNAKFKVEGLVQLAIDRGIDHVATGHYIRSAVVDGKPYLRRGVDPTKDQSYVLYMVPEKYRSMFVFPIGDYDKRDLRELASSFELSVADTPDSMDLCFNPVEHSNVTAVPVTLTRKGKVLGEHGNGTTLAVGQRKGLGIGGTSEPLYVGTKNLKDNTVELVTQDELMIGHIEFSGTTPDGEAFAQMSAHGTPHFGHVSGNKFIFETPVRRTSPGQTVVFYGINDLTDCVIGGGTII